MSMKSFISLVALAAVTGLVVSTASAQINIPTVPIGNPGNAADSTGYGSVAYTYNIGATEVTNAQYAVFLNSVAATDTYGLYNASMTTDSLGGITRLGSSGSYTYATVSGRENHPVNFVSFWDATRFANWLHNGQGSGDTETGAYTLTTDGIAANSVTRNAVWQWAVTSEDEWYKAAYHQPASAGGDADNYWAYPTQSNAIPTLAQVNFERNGIAIWNTTPVGSYAANYYGTFDMGGNVFEWNEGVRYETSRIVRGGSFFSGDRSLRADYRGSSWHSYEFAYFGFRVSQIPGPGSVALLAIGGLAAARRRR